MRRLIYGIAVGSGGLNVRNVRSDSDILFRAEEPWRPKD